MPLTKDFRETVRERAALDPAFRLGLFDSARGALADGEFGVALILLRDCVNATIGFKRLAAETGRNEKSLMRMLAADGNPTASSLQAILAALKADIGASTALAQVYGGHARAAESIPGKGERAVAASMRQAPKRASRPRS